MENKGEVKLNRIFVIGLTLIALGWIIGFIKFGNFNFPIFTQVGWYALVIMFSGVVFILVGIGRKLREWAGLS